MDSWYLMLALLGCVLAIVALLRRRGEVRHQLRLVAERAQAVARGSHRARLQHPSVDLSNCIGCGACVRACPEEGVLQMSYGQAVIVHGARCVGHGLCAQACPTSAIALTLGDLSERKDLPAIDEQHEAVGTPGLFLAGEITGFALVRTAVAHGAQVARAAHARVERQREAGSQAGDDDPELHDLLVIGVGPAGLSCMLAAKELGLRVVGVDQAEEIGGTVAAYPRKKLVMTQPMDLPLHGRLKRLEYTKEQLVELWQGLAKKHRLDVRLQATVDAVEREADGTFLVTAGGRGLRARTVCLSVGRRGTPRRLGVPGEEHGKVAYSLLDAAGYRGREVLVVGGGDSAIEAALALAEQPGNHVQLSYRREHFSRLKAKNEQRIAAAFEDGLVEARLGTVVQEIRDGSVLLRPAGDAEGADGAVLTAVEQLPNDDVFVFAGGTPPFPLLEAAGVSFDPAMRPPENVEADRGTGLLVAMLLTMLGLLALVVLRLGFADYYDLDTAHRIASARHQLLRPQGALGLACGLLAVVLFVANLAYLLRRSQRFGRGLPGTLKAWMNAHVATGIGACLLAVLHSGFALRDGAGGHALLAMIVVVLAGGVGRWFYAFLPRAQNGRQQHLEELGHKVSAIATEWDRDGRGFGQNARRMVEQLVDEADIGRTFVRRIWGLLRSQWRLRRRLREFVVDARREDVPEHVIHDMVQLSRRSHRLAMQLSHYDDLRGLLSAWRWMHRWLALLLGVLLVVHCVAALRYGGVDFAALFGGGEGR